jgi:predicted nucleic acid-binding protein
MSDDIFYDTNILVYAYDESEKERRQVAEKLVERVFGGETNGAISNQVLSELFYVLTEKINRPLSKDVAAKIIRKYVMSDKWKKVDYTNLTTLKAALSSSYFNTPFWDTLIAETMRENGMIEILTENEKDFKAIPGIKAVNPFKH